MQGITYSVGCQHQTEGVNYFYDLQSMPDRSLAA